MKSNIRPALKSDFPSPDEYTVLSALFDIACNSTIRIGGPKAKSMSPEDIMQISQSVLISPGEGTIRLLRQALDKEVGSGALTPDIRSHLMELFDSNDFRVFILKARNAYHMEKQTLAGFPITERMVEFAQAQTITEAEMKALESAAATIKPINDRYCTAIQSFGKNDLIKQWMKGKFNYREPVFSSPDDLDIFCDVFLTAGLERGLKGDAKNIIPQAIAALKSRLQARETGIVQEEQETLAKAEAAKLAKEARRKQAAEEQEKLARQREEAERKERAAFLAAPQPYKPDTHSEQLIGALLQSAGSSSQHVVDMAAPAAKTLAAGLAILDDIRPDPDADQPFGDVKELGDIVLNSVNILAAAKAFGAETLVKQLPAFPHGNPAANTKRVGKLYRASDAVHDRVNRLLDSEDGIILLSTFMRSPERAREYAGFLSGSRKARAKLQARIDELEQIISLFDEKDLDEIRKNPDLLPELKELGEKKAAVAHERELEVKAHHDLIKEIEEVLGGRKSKHVAATPSPAIEIIEPNKIELPLEWQESMGQEYEAKPGRNGNGNGNGGNGNGNGGNGNGDGNGNGKNKYIEIASKAYPALHFTIKRNTDSAAFKREMAALKGNVAMAQGCIERYGFTAEGTPDSLLLRHPEYAITVNAPEQLARAIEQFQSRQFEQRVLLESAQDAGMTVTGVNERFEAAGAVTVSHPELPAAIMAPRGYLSGDDFKAIETFTDAIQRKKDAPDVAPLPPEVPPTAEEAKTIVNWQPDASETLLIFDSSTLHNLATVRGKDNHTWLDLIKCTARLPNIKVIIPSIVADWESQGKIVTSDEHGASTGLEQVDRRFIKSDHKLHYLGEPIGRFLSSASRARMNPDGTIDLTPGANGNIIIMETPEDRVLYADIQRIERESSSNKEAKQRRQEEIHGHDEGEKAIDRIVEKSVLKNSMIIVSDDKHYFREVARRTSGAGMPVGQCSTGCYLHAEIKVREPDLRKKLQENDPLSVPRLNREIYEYWDHLTPGRATLLSWHNLRGKYDPANGREASDIYKTIKDAVAIARKANGQGAGTQPTWTALVGEWPRSHATANGRSIAPADIHKHRNDHEAVPGIS